MVLAPGSPAAIRNQQDAKPTTEETFEQLDDQGTEANGLEPTL